MEGMRSMFGHDSGASRGKGSDGDQLSLKSADTGDRRLDPGATRPPDATQILRGE